ncbi:MAG: hypothetical protein R3298_12575 [Gammaproteobacteria bacterium]|nr:hypothetical protein [Gammaproteobacteria bacterium]
MPRLFPIPIALLLLASGALAAPPPGHPDVNAAQRALGLGGPTAALPYTGTVVEALDSNSYTYLLVERDERRLWLAVPRLEIAAGERVRYGAGRTLSGFYSKKLRRNFAEVTFVPRAVPLR